MKRKIITFLMILTISISFTQVKSASIITDNMMCDVIFNSDAFNGNGTINDPYQITNITELQNINDNLSAHYILMNDINASSTRTWNSGKGFIPIGSQSVKFTGTLDGRGFKISNLVISRSDQWNIGLFGYTKPVSIISNLTLSNISIVGEQYIGGLIGRSQGSVFNCSSSGLIHGDFILGGIVGTNDGSVTSCYSDANISGISKLGGIVAGNYGEISGCASRTDVNGYNSLGGIAGTNYDKISECHSRSELNGQDELGGIAGSNFDLILHSNNSGSIIGKLYCGGIAGTNENGVVTNCDNFGNVSGVLIGGLIGTNRGTISYCSSQGNVISTDQNFDYKGVGGLIGVHNSGVIKYSDSSSTISGPGLEKGGLIGVSYGRIEYCHASGDVDGGGLVGTQYGNVIQDSWASGNVNGTHYNGGFIGKMYSNTVIQRCYSTGNVIGSRYAGGFIGKIFSGNIKQSYSTGKVVCTQSTYSMISGGFIGSNDGTVSDCYSTGDVDGVNGVGGFIGWNNGIIQNSYSTGRPNGSLDVGGFIGNNQATVDDCFFDNESSGTNASVNGYSRNTSDMTFKDTFEKNTNWDFNNIWDISDGYTYPFLRWSGNNPPKLMVNQSNITEEDSTYFNKFYIIDFDSWDVFFHIDFFTNANWISINKNNFSISGTPENIGVGSYWINISIADGRGGCDWDNFTLVVKNVNDPPTILPDPLKQAIEDHKYSVDYDIYDVDPTNDIIDVSYGSNASWLSFSTDTFILSGTPLNSDVGIYWVNISASDNNNGLSWQNFSIRVKNVNDPPIIETYSLPDAIEDKHYEFELNGIDVDPTDDTMTWYIQNTNASFIEIDPRTGTLSADPENEDVGEYWVIIQLTDGNGGVSSRNFDFRVNNTNDPPIMTIEPYSTIYENMPFSIQCIGSDVDPTNDVLTFSVLSNGDFIDIDPVSGRIFGTPGDFDTGSFWVNVILTDDKGGYCWKNFTIMVHSVNDPPMINKSVPFEYSIYEDDVDGIEIDLSSLFFDIEEEPLAFSYDNHMNFSMYIQNDILKIVSVKNWCGDEIIEVTANDSWSDTTVELSIKILPVNDPPTNFIISYNTSYTQNETIRFEASASDPDIEYGDVINITWSESSIGEIGYGGNIKPKFEPGSYNITVKVEDACGEYLLKSFQINISSLSDINNSDDDNDENNTESKDDDNIIIFIILTLIIIISLVCVVVFVYAIFRYKKNNSNNDNEREEESDDISTDNADEDVIAK